MTVAAESDFQSRPVIFRINQASVFRQLSVRGRHLNREHRRANVYIRKHSEFESRWLRVERKALVSCPTLNERLSISKNYSRNSARRSCRNRSRIFACAAFTSSFVSVRLRSRYVNLYARDFRAAPSSPPLKTSNNSTLSKSVSRGSWIARQIFSCEISSGTIIAISRVTAGNFSISRNFFLSSSGTKRRSACSSATNTGPDAVAFAEESCPPKPIIRSPEKTSTGSARSGNFPGRKERFGTTHSSVPLR